MRKTCTHWILAVSLLLPLIATLACGSRSSGPQATITRQDFGDQWPFTIDEGVLECRDNLILFTANGKTYAVDGRAVQKGQWEDVRKSAIWAPEAQVPGSKRNVSVIIRKGVSLCR